MLYRLTATLKPRQFTYIGYKKSLKTFTAPRANEFTIEYYDHNIIRTNQDQFLDDDRFANPQLNRLIHIHTIASYKIVLIYILHQDNHTIVFSFLTRSTLHHFFLISPIASRILTSPASSAIMTQ